MADLAYSAPSISGVSGTLTNGQALTISGTAFGTRNIGDTDIYDTMESGSYNSAWVQLHNMSIGTTAPMRDIFSTKQTEVSFDDATNDNMYLESSGTARDWHCQYNFKLGADFDFGNSDTNGVGNSFLDNIKIFRLWNGTNDNFYLQYDGFQNRIKIVWERTVGTPTILAFDGGLFTKGAYHTIKVAWRDSSAIGQSDGFVKVYFDGVIQYSSTTMLGKFDANGADKTPLIVGWQNEWGCGAGCQAPNSFYMDDVVLTANLARVEISTNPTYMNGGNYEVQPITSWANTSIGIIYRPQALDTNQNLYAYVIDSNDNVSSSFQITASPPSPAPKTEFNRGHRGSRSVKGGGKI